MFKFAVVSLREDAIVDCPAISLIMVNDIVISDDETQVFCTRRGLFALCSDRETQNCIVDVETSDFISGGDSATLEQFAYWQTHDLQRFLPKIRKIGLYWFDLDHQPYDTAFLACKAEYSHHLYTEVMEYAGS